MSDFALDLDELLDAAVLEAALADGRDPVLAARQFGVSRVIAAGVARGDVPAPPTVHGQANRWSAGELEYLRANAGVMGEGEIGTALGRSENAVRVKVRRLGLACPTTHPGYLTAQRAALALGVDVHAVCGWIDRGLLAAELAPVRGRRIWRIRRSSFYAWALNPLNWVYFIRSVRRPERIRDEELRRLIMRRKGTWIAEDGRPDEWWSIGEVAEYHGVVHQFINKYIRNGRLPAVDWGNWWIRRSEATRPGFHVFRREDGMLYRRGTVGGDGFLVLAMAVGLPSSHIARMMGGRLSDSGVVTRYRVVEERGLVPWLARVYDLPLIAVERTATSARAGESSWWVDWRRVAHRFPALSRAWARLERPGMPERFDRALLGRVMAAFLRCHHPDYPTRLGRGDASVVELRAVKRLYEEMLPWTG